MSDTPATANTDLAKRFAALVALIAEQPSSVMDHREAVKGIVAAVKGGAATITLLDGALQCGGEPFDAPLVASRFTSYGIEELSILPNVASADLMDLARLLASEPAGEDPAARFAGRAAAIDQKTLPRRLRPREEIAVADAPSSPPTRSRPTPSLRPTTAVQAITNAAVPVAPATPAIAEVAAPLEAPTVDREAPEPLAQALAVPEVTDPLVAAQVRALREAPGITELRSALDQMVNLTELAFRTGRYDDLIEALTSVVAIEFEALEKDSADERRQAFNHAIRQLARPVLLRQVAVLRHTRASDAVASLRLQQVLYRFGTDGAEALVDEYVSAATHEARMTCLTALRGLRRTHDALHFLARDTRDLVVRQAAAILGELRDARGEAILVELLHHPDARARRSAVAALGNFESASAIEALGLALQDESPIVRLRAVAALTARRVPRAYELVAPLLDAEPDREVLYAAIAAAGSIASPEAVQRLIRIAQGEGAHPQHKTAGMRLQACIALANIRTPATMAAVQGLRDDRDREVREAAVRLVAQAQRRTTITSGITAVQA